MHLSNAFSPMLAEELQCQPPSTSYRQRNRFRLRSDSSFVDRLDRVQILGSLDSNGPTAAERRPGRGFTQQYGHTGCINALSWSPDGQVLASGSDDTKICLWKMGLGTAPTEASDLNSELQSSAPKLDFGLSGSNSYWCDTVTTFYFYNMCPYCGVGLLLGHTANIFSVKWSDRRRLISAAGDDQIRVFDLNHAGKCGHAPSLAQRAGQEWCEWGTRDGALFRVLTCHTDRVKRIATEESPDIFLTCSEDGTVRQHDLRVSHTCGRDRSGCGPPLVSYADAGISLYSLSLSRLRPWNFVVAGTSPFGYLHDRRMNPVATSTEWNVRFHPTRSTQCVRRFGLPEPSEDSASNKSADRRRLRDTGVHVTAAKLSDYNSRDLLLSYSGDKIYLFDILQELPTPTSSVGSVEQRTEERSAASGPASSHGKPKLAIKRGRSKGSDSENLEPTKKSSRADRHGKESPGLDADDEASNPKPLDELDLEMEAEKAPLLEKGPEILQDGHAEGDRNGEPASAIDGRIGGSMMKDQVQQEEEEREGEDDGEDSGTNGSNGDENSEGDDNEPPLGRWRNRRQTAEPGVPILLPLRSYTGHMNEQTVKDVNFGGALDNFVMSGSDDGNFFIWDKRTGDIKGIFEGDNSVVNVITGHPILPIIAVSGIDETAKIFAPTVRNHPQCSKMADQEAIMDGNRSRRRLGAFGPRLTHNALLALLEQQLEDDAEGNSVPRFILRGPDGDQECLIM